MKYHNRVWCLFVSVALCFSASGGVLINEMMSSNSSTIADEDSDFEDWIELINTGSTAVDLSGWGLSDSESDPFEWTFPAGAEISPGGFLHVWASGKDRAVPIEVPATLIPGGSDWNYLDTGLPAAGWTQNGFDLSLWSVGAAPLGYGSAFVQSTPLSNGAAPVFFRRSFTVAEPMDYVGLELDLATHLGAVVHVNGSEVARHMMPDGPLGGTTAAHSIPIDGLSMWVAADRSMMTRTVGAETFVSQWTDLSGNGNHLVQANESYQPAFIDSAVNGHPALEFDGTNHRMSSAAFATGGEVTIFVVAKPDGGASNAYGRVFAHGSNSAGIMLTRWNGSQACALRIDTSAQFNQNRTGGVLFNSQWRHIGLMTGPNAVELKLDGYVSISHPYAWGDGITTNQPFVLGANYSASGGLMQGQVAEVIVYDRQLSDVERSLVESYLNRKYGRPATVPRVSYAVDASVLLPGENTIAVEMRQQSPSDADLIFDLELKGLEPEFILHTNFKISASGEPIKLTSPDTGLADSVPATSLSNGLSYGRQPDGTGPFFYFDEPTPGSTNSTTAYPSIAPSPVFSHPPGFYTATFDLGLGTLGPSVTILYTLDGSDPSFDDLGGTTFHYKNSYPQDAVDTLGPLIADQRETFTYSAPIPIVDRSAQPNHLSGISTTTTSTLADYAPTEPTFKATVVRAKAFLPGSLPSSTWTGTFFISPLGENLYQLPVFSISTDPEGLFGYESGIYVAGKTFDDAWVANPQETQGNFRLNAQMAQRGSDWERASHMECFVPGEGRVLSQDLGIRIHGASSRFWPLKSLRLYPRGSYGAPRIEYPFFDLDPISEVSPRMEEFEYLILSSGGSTVSENRLREPLQHRLAAPLGVDGSAHRLAAQFINGEYWGITNIRERMGKRYFEDYYGADPDKTAILSGSGQIYDATAADGVDYMAMLQYAVDNDLSDPVHMSYMEERMDVENYIAYLTIELYCANFDWPANNIRFWRTSDPTTTNGVGDNRWRWFLIDLDTGFINPDYPSITKATTPHPVAQWSSLLLSNLLDDEGFRNRLINSLAEAMNTVFAPARVDDFWNEILTEFLPYQDEHLVRWRNVAPIYETAPNLFGRNRPPYMRQHIVDHFGLAGTADLTVSTPNSSEGRVSVNKMVIDEDTPGHPTPLTPYPWSGTCFQGVPVTLKALPEPGYRFAGWQELPSEESAEISVPLTGNATFTALFEVDTGPEPSVVHAWDFEAEVFAIASYSLGGGVLTAEFVGTGAWEREADSQSFSSAHLRVNDPIGSTLTWALPTTGFEKVTMGFETRRSGQGAESQILSYTLNGLSWVELQTYGILNSDPQQMLFDFSAVSGSEDNPDFAVRISFAQGNGGTGGNNRFDNVLLRGDALGGTNLSPVVESEIGRQEAVAGTTTPEIDLTSVFTDPNGDTMSFQASIEPAGLVTATVDSDSISINALQTGNATVTVTASDGVTPPTETSFPLLVYPAPHRVADGDYLFRDWSSDSAAGTFPGHMVFLQGEGNDDSILTTSLTRAYEIPAASAAEPADVLLPYDADSRTRINGIGAGGVAFINTGRGRDLGSAVLALDTRDVGAVSLAWLAGTVSPNDRVYALRLQARDGVSGDFADVLIGGQPVEYQRNVVAGHREAFGPLSLPAELLNLENLQLQWRYHLISGSSGARAQLSLDDIVVSIGEGPRLYETWRLAEYSGLSERDDDGISGPLADAGGTENLLRYGLGAGRDSALSEFLPHVTNEAGMVFRFPFDVEKADLRFVARESSDLEDWSGILFDSDVDDWLIFENGGWLEIPDNSGGVRRFYRLDVEFR